nr:endopeptidase La [Muribaculaceae bacterium]
MSRKRNYENTLENSYEAMNTDRPVNGFITEVTSDFDFSDVNFDEHKVPVIPLRDMVIFPFITMPMPVTDSKVLDILSHANSNRQAVMCVAVRNNAEVIRPEDLYDIGVVCVVGRLMALPDGSYTAIMVAANRAKALKWEYSTEGDILADIECVEEKISNKKDMQIPAILSSIKDRFLDILNLYSDEETKDARYALSGFTNPFKMMNFVICSSPISMEQKQHLLEESSIKKRGKMLLTMLDTAYQMLEIKIDIQERTREDLSRQQRDIFLQQQMRNIREELGDTPEDSDEAELTAKAEKMEWSEEASLHFAKELKKLGRFAATTPEYGIQYTYLNTLLSLPWNKKREQDFTLDHVEEVLNRDHYGLEKIKDRILEQVAVMKLRGDLKSPILCLYGPPGVGKTSLGKSIAEALGREYARISLGGMHDEAEIRGHRRTYIGAMPGRIIAALEKTETNNPVIVLDEIDKISRDMKGDPAAALLEVLDPEQNSRFHDNYIDIDYDLSDVFFIATANTTDPISAPLLDRMELIEVSGYIIEEKIEIARRHLLPNALSDLGFEAGEISISDEGLRFITEKYTRESGVRQLDKELRRMLRRLARLKASSKPLPSIVGKEEARDLLGKERHTGEIYEGNDYIGVVTGLAWTQSGGEILFIETSLSKGKVEKLTLTVNLGDVMKVSATIALQY